MQFLKRGVREGAEIGYWLCINAERPPGMRGCGADVGAGFACAGPGLLTDTEFFLGDDGAVAADVFLLEVVKEATTLTYQHFKCAFSCMIFVI